MSSNKYNGLIKLYEKTDKSKQEILSDITGEESRIRNANPKWSDEDVFEHLSVTIYNKQKRIVSDVGSEEFVIEIHHFGRSIDWTAKYHRECEKMAKKDPKKAEDEFYIKVLKWKPDGTPDNYIHLDYREKKADKSVNNNWKRKLPDSSFIRRIGGICLRRSASEVGFKKFELILGDNLADPDSPDYRTFPINTKLNIMAKLAKETADNYQLQGRAVTFFNHKNDEYDDTDIKTLEVLYEDDIINLMDVDEVFESNINLDNPHSRRSYKLCLAKCQVIAIEPATGNRSALVYVDTIPVWTKDGELDTTQCRGMYDDDGNKLAAFQTWWNEELIFDFGVGSIIYLFFTMSQNEMQEDKKYTGEWTNIIFNAGGCFMIKRVERETKEHEDDSIEVTEEIEVAPELDELESAEFGGEVQIKENEGEVVEFEMKEEVSDNTSLSEDDLKF